MANWNAISVSMDVADIPICGPKWAGLIQNTTQDMETIKMSGKMTFQTK